MPLSNSNNKHIFCFVKYSNRKQSRKCEVKNPMNTNFKCKKLGSMISHFINSLFVKNDKHSYVHQKQSAIFFIVTYARHFFNSYGRWTNQSYASSHGYLSIPHKHWLTKHIRIVSSHTARHFTAVWIGAEIVATWSYWEILRIWLGQSRCFKALWNQGLPVESPEIITKEASMKSIVYIHGRIIKQDGMNYIPGQLGS